MKKHPAIDEHRREDVPVHPLHGQIFQHLGIAPDGTHDVPWDERCRRQNLDPSTVTRMLEAFDRVQPPAPAVAIELMTLTELCDHIEQTHHQRLQETLAQLDSLIDTAHADGEFPADQGEKISQLFRTFRTETVAHLREESRILFPLIRQIEAGIPDSSPTPRTLRETLAEMEHEHNQADEALAELHTLVRTLKPSWDAALNQLQSDLHEQIYKENHALFPRALALAGTR